MGSQNRSKEQVAGAVPGAVEHLLGSLMAGQTLDEAIERLAAEEDNALTAAFGVMMDQVRAGVSRRQAIESMAEELDVPEVTALVKALLGADLEGRPLEEVLQDFLV